MSYISITVVQGASVLPQFQSLNPIPLAAIVVLRVWYILSGRPLDRILVLVVFTASVITSARELAIIIPTLKVAWKILYPFQLSFSYSGCFPPSIERMWTVFLPYLAAQTVLFLASFWPIFELWRKGRYSQVTNQVVRECVPKASLFCRTSSHTLQQWLRVLSCIFWFSCSIPSQPIRLTFFPQLPLCTLRLDQCRRVTFQYVLLGSYQRKVLICTVIRFSRQRYSESKFTVTCDIYPHGESWTASHSLLLAGSTVSVSRLLLRIGSLASHLKIDPEILLSTAELSRVKWRQGAYDGELIVEINATEDPYDMSVMADSDASGLGTAGCYTTEVGVYEDALLPFP